MITKKTNRFNSVKLVDVGDFVTRLTSRKFALTIATCIYFMWRGEPAFASLTQVVIAFLAIQGGTDALAKLAEVRMTGSPSQSDYNSNMGELDPNVVNAAQNAQYGMQTNNFTPGPVPPGD